MAGDSSNEDDFGFNGNISRGTKMIMAHFVLDCLRQSRELGRHPFARVQLDSTLLYGEKYKKAGVQLTSALRRGVQSMGMQCVSLEGLRFLDAHGRYRHLTDRLWSPSGSPEDACFSGPYHEAFDAFIEPGELPSEKIRGFLSRLEPREEKVIRMRFGIGERREYTLEETGERLGVTRARIWQIEAEALRKLSKAMLNYMAQDTGLTKTEKGLLKEKIKSIPKARKTSVKKPKDPMQRLQTVVARQFWMKRKDVELIGQLNGWYGYKKTSFAQVAARRGVSWREQAIHANTLSERLRHLGVWPDAPVYRLYEKIYWNDRYERPS